MRAAARRAAKLITPTPRPLLSKKLIELLPTVASQIVVPPGNSGYIPPTLTPEPPHLRDQVALYEAFQYHALPFVPAELEGPTTTQTITVP